MIFAEQADRIPHKYGTVANVKPRPVADKIVIGGVKCMTRKDKTKARKMNERRMMLAAHKMKFNIRGKYNTRSLRSKRLERFRKKRAELKFSQI